MFKPHIKIMEIKYNITIQDKNNYENINSILKNELQISNRLLTKLVKSNSIMLNGSICDTRNNFNINDILIINFDFEEDSDVIPTKITLDIIYEDEWLLIVNKPARMAIHPSILHYSDSLSNGIKYYFDSIGLKKKIRPVNRLDFNTSRIGCICKMRIYPRMFKQRNEGKHF